MDRRDFLKSAGVTAASSVLAGPGLAAQPDAAASAGAGEVSGPPPNILFILVDELRFPSVFPAGVTSVDGFLARFMPNVHSLWQSGVKFGSHYTAASACSPSRGVLISGLYSQQSWLLQTIKNEFVSHISPTPPLNPVFPTYGKLLRAAGYQTPYIGKWHASVPAANDAVRLQIYGFEGLTYPDPAGSNLQGTVGDHTIDPPYLNDQDISNQATQWLSARKPGEDPWCLTVGFVNPHDQEFFWAGTEFQTYNDLFPAGSVLQPILTYSTEQTRPLVSWDNDPLKSPTPLGYPALPPNWETGAQLLAKSPTQYFARLFSEAVWGGVDEDPSQSGFTVRQYPGAAINVGMAYAPFSYWQRCLDSYTNLMSIVDQRIGEVVGSLAPDVAQNTIIIFGSDHGDYAGAHGFVSGKVGSCYEEPFHVPLIVVDPSGRFVGDTETIRTGLTSSVDMLTLLVSLGYCGRRDWMKGDLATIYGKRHDMLPMLRSASAPGRPYVLLATDELVPGFYNFNNAPLHIAALRTEAAKLGTYSKWNPVNGEIVPGSTNTEFYDYATPQGVAELASTPGDPRAQGMLAALLDDLIPNELRAPLPGRYGRAQTVSRDLYLLFQAAITNLPPGGFSGQDLRMLLGFGAEF